MKTTYPPTFSRRAVSLIFAINGFLYTNWAARIPRLQEMYGLSEGQISMILLAHGIGALLIMPLTGKLIARTGSRVLTMVMLLLFCSLTMFIPSFPSIWGIGTVLFLVGASAGSLDIAMNAQASLIEQDYGRPIMSSFHAIFSAGMMLGASSAGLFTQCGVSVQWHLVIVVTLAISLALFAIRYLVYDQPETQSTADQTATTSIWQRPRVLVLGIIAFCCMLGEGSMTDWTALYLEKVSMGSPDWSAFGVTAFAAAMMIGRFLGDEARQRLGDSLLMKTGAILAATGLVVALVFPSILPGILGFFLVGLGLSTIVPIAYSVAGNLPGLAPGVGISMVTSIGYAGFLVGPAMIGLLAEWQGLRFGMTFVLLLFVVMLLLNFSRYLRTESVAE
ncbi:MAG: MFS transporter [Bacteroidota bacterium]